LTPAELEEWRAKVEAWRKRMEPLGAPVKPLTPAGGLMPAPKDPKPVPQHHTERWEQVDEEDDAHE
jgi:hypothetical protein